MELGASKLSAPNEIHAPCTLLRAKKEQWNATNLLDVFPWGCRADGRRSRGGGRAVHAAGDGRRPMQLPVPYEVPPRAGVQLGAGLLRAAAALL